MQLFEQFGEPPMAEVTPLPELRQVALIVHPQNLALHPEAGRHVRGQRRNNQVKKYLHSNGVIISEQATSPNPDGMLEIMDDISEHFDAAFLVGGDGVHSAGLNALHALKSELPVYLIRGGNANDGANAFINPLYRNRPRKMLKLGYVEHRPIEIETTTSAGQKLVTERAFFYASLGTTAALGAVYDSALFREMTKGWSRPRQLLAESLLAANAAEHPTQLSVQSNGQIRELTDYILFNIDRMGKAVRPRQSTLANSSSVYEAHYTHLAALLASLGRVTIGSLPKLELEGRTINVSSSTGEFWKQIDGESSLQASGTSFRFQRAAYGVNVVTSLKR